MEGSVLNFLKAKWKLSDTGSAHWASSLVSWHYKYSTERVDLVVQSRHHPDLVEIKLVLSMIYAARKNCSIGVKKTTFCLAVSQTLCLAEWQYSWFRPKKKIVCLRSPDRPQFLLATLWIFTQNSEPFLLFNQQQCFIYSTASFLSKLRAKKVEKLHNSSFYRKFWKWNIGFRNRERLFLVLPIIKK